MIETGQAYRKICIMHHGMGSRIGVILEGFVQLRTGSYQGGLPGNCNARQTLVLGSLMVSLALMMARCLDVPREQYSGLRNCSIKLKFPTHILNRPLFKKK